MMSFMSTVITSYFPTTNNQLRNSSNPRQHANIHDGRVTVQPVQGRQSSFAAGTSGTRANILRTGGDNSGQQGVMKCFNCQGEGHMARQCPKPKRKRDATWFRDKGNVTIKRVYYVEGLNHNLFSVGQFCDAYLKVTFLKSACYICDLKGNDFPSGFGVGVDMAYPRSWIRRIQGLGYGVLGFLGRIDHVVFVFSECWHKYTVSSLMDTAYWLSEQ
ncbi:retrovirus-related pol polyprotein from transposon TNT 1-94 [Tanacetum coccineum]